MYTLHAKCQSLKEMEALKNEMCKDVCAIMQETIK